MPPGVPGVPMAPGIPGVPFPGFGMMPQGKVHPKKNQEFL
jgi:hypothetical protein